jgi:hypothetical protein
MERMCGAGTVCQLPENADNPTEEGDPDLDYEV